MRELFIRFIESPDKDTYLALRAAIMATADYDPYSSEFEAAAEQYDQGLAAEARDALLGAIPNLLLSPGAHQMLSFLSAKCGDEEASKMEMMIAAACAEGILATGSGTAEEPYIVLRTSDEYDIVEYLGKEAAKQSLHEHGGRHLDRLECQDGTEYWFDISDAFAQLSKRMQG